MNSLTLGASVYFNKFGMGESKRLLKSARGCEGIKIVHPTVVYEFKTSDLEALVYSKDESSGVLAVNHEITVKITDSVITVGREVKVKQKDLNQHWVSEGCLGTVEEIHKLGRLALVSLAIKGGSKSTIWFSLDDLILLEK